MEGEEREAGPKDAVAAADFEGFFRGYHSVILAAAFNRLNDLGAAEDVAAEVFAVAWRRRNDFPDAPLTLPWLYATLRNVVGNELRRRKRTRRREQRAQAVFDATAHQNELEAENAENDEELDRRLAKTRPPVPHRGRGLSDRQEQTLREIQQGAVRGPSNRFTAQRIGAAGLLTVLVAAVCIGVTTVDREGIWPEHTTGETVVFAEIDETLGSAAASAVLMSHGEPRAFLALQPAEGTAKYRSWSAGSGEPEDDAGVVRHVQDRGDGGAAVSEHVSAADWARYLSDRAGPDTTAGQVFRAVRDVMTEQQLSPVQRAALFEYLATLDGIYLDTGVTDDLGRVGVGVEYTVWH